ncbi:MAG: LPS export ABC transporter periplasmic protein LptC [Alphaproteobacteria bacterium]|nr:LPS export ABC transporter periplasmic protein LptC [Alphaproteobacteria bacterium]
MTASAPESFEARGSGQLKDAPDNGRGDFGDYFNVTERRRARPYHGRFVGVAKLLLVTLTAALILLLAIWPQLHNKEGPTEIGQVEGVREEDVESLRITKAKLTGINKDGLPYMMTFDDANQTSQESDLVRLTAPQADVELKDGAWVTLSSPKGRYHRGNRILELDGDVAIFHDSGMEMTTGNVTFNLESGTGAGYDPIHAQAPFGSFDAQGFRIREHTAVFHFTGPVRAVLYSVPELGQ